jgi:hypothetical protein
VRFTGYGKLVCAASLIELGTREKNIAAVEVCSCALRIGLDRRFVERHCLRNPTLFFQRISFIGHRDCRCNSLGVVNLCGRQIHGSYFEISHTLSLADCMADYADNTCGIPQIRARQDPAGNTRWPRRTRMARRFGRAGLLSSQWAPQQNCEET